MPYISPNIHVSIATGHYIGQIRKAGYRRWTTVTGKCRSPESAISKAVSKMKGYKRARVLFIDNNPYYEPSIAMTCER